MLALIMAVGAAAIILAASWRRHPPPGHALIIRRANRTDVTQTSAWALPGQSFPVDLSARTLTIVHRRRSALSCADGIRADISFTATVSIPDAREAILRAADVLGPDLATDRRVAEHFTPRFEQAIRAQLQARPFAEWSADLAALTDAIVAAVGTDLDGFQIESAAVIRFEQAPLDSHDPENALDALGIRSITAAIEAERTRTEAIVHAATLKRARNELEAKRELSAIDEELAQYGGASESVLDRLRARRAAQAAEEDENEDALTEDDEG